MKKDFFLKSKLVLAVNELLTIAALIYFDIGAAEFGFLVGAALATGLCTHPDKAFGVCLPTQLALIAAFVCGASIWGMLPIFFFGFPALLCIVKDADRVSLLGVFILALLFPLIGVVLVAGFEQIVCCITY